MALEAAVAEAQLYLKDLQQEWDLRNNAILNLQKAVQERKGTPGLLNVVRPVFSFLSIQLAERRSILILNLCNLISYLSTTLGDEFEHGAELVLPGLFKLLVVTIKAIQEPGHRCILSIVSHTRIQSCWHRLHDGMCDKHPVMRGFCAEYIARVLERTDLTSVQENLGVIEDCIKRAAGDSSEAGRTAGRKAFSTYVRLNRAGAEVFLKKLDITLQKKLQPLLDKPLPPTLPVADAPASGSAATGATPAPVTASISKRPNFSNFMKSFGEIKASATGNAARAEAPVVITAPPAAAAPAPQTCSAPSLAVTVPAAQAAAPQPIAKPAAPVPHAAAPVVPAPVPVLPRMIPEPAPRASAPPPVRPALAQFSVAAPQPRVPSAPIPTPKPAAIPSKPRALPTPTRPKPVARAAAPIEVNLAEVSMVIDREDEEIAHAPAVAPARPNRPALEASIRPLIIETPAVSSRELSAPSAPAPAPAAGCATEPPTRPVSTSSTAEAGFAYEIRPPSRHHMLTQETEPVAPKLFTPFEPALQQANTTTAPSFEHGHALLAAVPTLHAAPASPVKHNVEISQEPALPDHSPARLAVVPTLRSAPASPEKHDVCIEQVPAVLPGTPAAVAIVPSLRSAPESPEKHDAELEQEPCAEVAVAELVLPTPTIVAAPASPEKFDVALEVEPAIAPQPGADLVLPTPALSLPPPTPAKFSVAISEEPVHVPHPPAELVLPQPTLALPPATPAKHEATFTLEPIPLRAKSELVDQAELSSPSMPHCSEESQAAAEQALPQLSLTVPPVSPAKQEALEPIPVPPSAQLVDHVQVERLQSPPELSSPSLIRICEQSQTAFVPDVLPGEVLPASASQDCSAAQCSADGSGPAAPATPGRQLLAPVDLWSPARHGESFSFPLEVSMSSAAAPSPVAHVIPAAAARADDSPEVAEVFPSFLAAATTSTTAPAATADSAADQSFSFEFKPAEMGPPETAAPPPSPAVKMVVAALSHARPTPLAALSARPHASAATPSAPGSAIRPKGLGFGSSTPQRQPPNLHAKAPPSAGKPTANSSTPQQQRKPPLPAAAILSRAATPAQPEAPKPTPVTVVPVPSTSAGVPTPSAPYKPAATPSLPGKPTPTPGTAASKPAATPSAPTATSVQPSKPAPTPSAASKPAPAATLSGSTTHAKPDAKPAARGRPARGKGKVAVTTKPDVPAPAADQALAAAPTAAPAEESTRPSRGTRKPAVPKAPAPAKKPESKVEKTEEKLEGHAAPEAQDAPVAPAAAKGKVAPSRAASLRKPSTDLAPARQPRSKPSKEEKGTKDEKLVAAGPEPQVTRKAATKDDKRGSKATADSKPLASSVEPKPAANEEAPAQAPKPARKQSTAAVVAEVPAQPAPAVPAVQESKPTRRAAARSSAAEVPPAPAPVSAKPVRATRTTAPAEASAPARRPLAPRSAETGHNSTKEKDTKAATRTGKRGIEQSQENIGHAAVPPTPIARRLRVRGKAE